MAQFIPAPIKEPGLFGAIGQGLMLAGQGLGQRWGRQAEQQDLASIQAWQRGQQNLQMPGFQGPIQQPQFPQMISPRFRGIQGELGITQAFGQGDPFTLGPGQTRFGPGGRPVARVPAKKEIPPSKIVGDELFERNITTGKWESTGIKAKTATPDEKMKVSTTFRKEFDALSSDYRKVRDSYSRVLASAQNPSAAGDLALIFNYMKILDPGSVVRESEFANAAASGSFGSRIQAAGLKIISGERLSPAMRADFVNRSTKLFNSQKNIQKKLINRYTGLSKRFGIEPRDVITETTEFVTPTPEEQQQYEIGQIVFDNGEEVRITGFDTDGTPIGEPVR